MGERLDQAFREKRRRSASPMIRAASCGPSCRRRSPTCGSAAPATDSKPVGPSRAAERQARRGAARTRRTRRRAIEQLPAVHSGRPPPASSRYWPERNGIAPGMTDQAERMTTLRAVPLHQVGSKPTRTIPDLDKFPSAEAAWDHRVLRGQRGTLMSSFMTGFGRDRGLKMFAEWTNAIPKRVRCQTRCRRVRAASSGTSSSRCGAWGDNVAFVHDEISTDKRNPRVNPNGLVYGVDIGNDNLLIADPVNHWSEMLRLPTREDRFTIPSFFAGGKFPAYRNFGERQIWVGSGRSRTTR